MKKYIFVVLFLILNKIAYAENIYYKNVELPSRNAAILTPPNINIKIIVKNNQKSVITNWISPKNEGDYSVTVNGNEQQYKIKAIVGTSSKNIKNGYLNDFYIGDYPAAKGTFKHLYKMPAYFYKITDNIADFYISKDYTIRNLVIDTTENLPQYIVFDYNLLYKLNAIKKELQKNNKPFNLKFIGGAYITPANNKIRYENGKGMVASISRHMYGDAVDFVVDGNFDGDMDDLNDDGVIDYLDARYLEKLVTGLENKHKCKIGGFGMYAPPKNEYVTVHVDTRGYKARWEFK